MLQSRFDAGMLVLNMKSLIPEAAALLMISTWNMYSQIWVSMLWCCRCQNQISLQSISLNQIPWIILYPRGEIGFVTVFRITDKFAYMLFHMLCGHGGVRNLKMICRWTRQIFIIPKRMSTSFELTWCIESRRPAPLRLDFIYFFRIPTTASGMMFKLTRPKQVLRISAIDHSTYAHEDKSVGLIVSKSPWWLWPRLPAWVFEDGLVLVVLVVGSLY